MRLIELPIFKITICPSYLTEISQVGFEVTGKKRGKRGCINNPERKITAS